MKNKITSISIAQLGSDNIKITIMRDLTGREYTIDAGLSYNSVDKMNAIITKYLNDGVWRATGIQDIGDFDVILSVRFVPVEKQEYFEITSVHREDLERLGFDVTNVDDSTMLRLASKMSDSYTASGEFWAELEYHGEMLDIPRPDPKGIYNDEDSDDE